MQQIEITYDVERAPGAAFAFLTDFSHLRRWRTLESLRVEPEGPLRVGSSLLTTAKGLGNPMRFTNEVTALDPAGRVYDDRALDGTFLIESCWVVEPRDSGARFRWNTRFQLRGPMVLLTPILRRALRQGQLRDLEKLKAIVEQGTNG